MLIPLQDLNGKYHFKISGILHIGAHECEERSAYHSLGISDNDIIWIDAIPNLVHKMKMHDPSIKIYQAAISDQEGINSEFIVTNNYQSSSLLELGTHKQEHPHIMEIARISVKTDTIDSFFTKYPELTPKRYNFINIDIQGMELKALKGMEKSIMPFADYLYLEVNTKELYKGGALLHELDDYLRIHNFLRVDTLMTCHGWGDALYIRSQLLI